MSSSILCFNLLVQIVEQGNPGNVVQLDLSQRFDFSRNYMDCDTSLMMTTLEYGLNYLSTCWSAMGRPIITLIMGDNMLGG